MLPCNMIKQYPTFHALRTELLEKENKNKSDLFQIDSSMLDQLKF